MSECAILGAQGVASRSEINDWLIYFAWMENSSSISWNRRGKSSHVVSTHRGPVIMSALYSKHIVLIIECIFILSGYIFYFSDQFFIKIFEAFFLY